MQISCLLLLFCVTFTTSAVFSAAFCLFLSVMTRALATSIFLRNSLHNQHTAVAIISATNHRLLHGQIYKLPVSLQLIVTEFTTHLKWSLVHDECKQLLTNAFDQHVLTVQRRQQCDILEHINTYSTTLPKHY